MEDSRDNKVAELPRPPEERGESFYVVGGPVQPRRGCYILRPADGQIVEKLHDGEYCHVIGPPQTGKSSLLARAARELRRQGFLVAVVDLSQTVGRDRESEAGRWNYGVAYRIVRDLRLSVDLQHWWQEKKPLAPLQRINEFFWEVVLGNSRSPLVIFLDHVEAITHLDYAADLFHAVRACHDARASEPDYERLTFGIFGTVQPGGPAGSLGSSMFEIGRRIDLTDFTFEEARPLCREIGLEAGDAERALYRIFYWTGGQPYLTQKLCRAIGRNPRSVQSDADVDQFVSSRFLTGSAPQNEPNLRRIRSAAEQKNSLAHASLRLYRKVRKGRRLRYDRHQPEHEWLRITGLASVSMDGQLHQRNRIYSAVFSSRWIRHVVPFDWRGLARKAAIVALIIGVPYWYSQELPKGYVKTLSRPGAEFSEVQEAFVGLRRLPGFRERAQALYARVLEQRSLAADSWDEALAADVELRAVGGFEERADELLADFWNRQSQEAAAGEMRDQALIYQLRALDLGARQSAAQARALVGDDYPSLVTGIRPGARIDGLGIDPGGRRVVTLTEGHVIQSWDADTGRPAGAPGGFPALAEEFVTVRRRASIEAEGEVGDVTLEVFLRHPQASDLELRLVAPSGRKVAVPIRRQNREAAAPYIFDATDFPEFGRFRGEKAQGSWTLELEDRFTGTTGFLDGWILILSERKGGLRTEDIPGNPILLPDPRPTSQVDVSLSPDGRRAAAVSSNRDSRGFLQVWDTYTGALTARIPVQAGPRIAAFDAEGQYLVTGTTSPPAALSVWRAAAGQELLTLEAPDGFMTAPAMSVSGSVLGVAQNGPGGSSRIRLFDLADGSELPSIDVAGELQQIALGSGGEVVATLHSGGVVDVWKADGTRFTAESVHDRPVVRLILDPSSRWLATVDESNLLRVWSLRDREGNTRLLATRETWDPLSVTFSDNGDMLVLRGRGRTFEVLSLPSGRLAATPLRHSGDWRSDELSSGGDGPVSRAFAAGGTRVVTGRGGPMARVWQLEPHTVTSAAEDPGLAVAQVFALSPTTDQIAAGGEDGSIRLLDRGGPWSPGADAAAGHAGAITALAFSPDGGRLVSVGADGSVLLWDPIARKTVGERFHHGSGRVDAVAVATNNRLIVTGGELGARLWDGQTGEPGPVLGPGRRVVAVAFSGDGRVAYTASVNGVVQAWDVRDGAPVWSGNMPGPIWSLAVSDDGRWVAGGEATGRIFLWDTTRLIGSRRMVRLNGWPLGMTFDEAGQSLFVQTAEWLHRLTVDQDLEITGSMLLPGALAPHAWRLAENEAASPRILAVDSSGQRIVYVDLFARGPRDTTLGSLSEIDWLDRLKLRFDATGTLLPVTVFGSRFPQDAAFTDPTGDGQSPVEPRPGVTDGDPEVPPLDPAADPQ